MPVSGRVVFVLCDTVFLLPMIASTNMVEIAVGAIQKISISYVSTSSVAPASR